jgi:hypothetical protein
MRLLRPYFNTIDSETQPLVRNISDARVYLAMQASQRHLVRTVGLDVTRLIALYAVGLHDVDVVQTWSPDYTYAASYRSNYPFLRILRESVAEHADHRLMLREEVRSPIALLRSIVQSCAVSSPCVGATLRIRDRAGPVAITHRLTNDHPNPVSWSTIRAVPRNPVLPLRPFRSPALTFLAGLLYTVPYNEGPYAEVVQDCVTVRGMGRLRKYLIIRTSRGHKIYWKPPHSHVSYIQARGLYASGLPELLTALRATRACGCLVVRVGDETGEQLDGLQSWFSVEFSM